MKGRWWTVTAYYPLTSVSMGILADNEAMAEELALAAMAEEWGARKIYQYEDIEVRRQGD